MKMICCEKYIKCIEECMNVHKHRLKVIDDLQFEYIRSVPQKMRGKEYDDFLAIISEAREHFKGKYRGALASAIANLEVYNKEGKE